MDNGDTLTLVTSGPTDCGSDYDITDVIDYDASTFRSHTNETGQQCKERGDRGVAISVRVFQISAEVEPSPGTRVARRDLGWRRLRDHAWLRWA